MIAYLMILIVSMFFCTSNCGASSSCKQEVQLSYLNGEMYMIARSKINFPSKPKDCAELYVLGHHQSGIYTVWLANRLFEDMPIEVYCDMDTSGGGWTVIQRRGQFNNSEDYFFKDWDSYKVGFGKKEKEKEFWLGNDMIYALTNQKIYSARFDMKDIENDTAFAQYDSFWIDDENNQYMLHIDGYTGTAGDSLGGFHDNQKFSTYDQDNDEHEDKNCAEFYEGAWWYKRCHRSNLNGTNRRGMRDEMGRWITWKTWKGYQESLDSVEIKVRPQDFKLSSLYHGYHL